MKLKDLFDLTGKTALITGGSRGLGLQVAEALGEFGARIVLVSRKKDDLAEAAQMLESQGIEALYVPADLSSGDGVAALTDHLAGERIPIDILVNSAGLTWGSSAADYPAEAWDKVINLNLSSAFRMIQSVANRWMLPAQCGAIINLASIEGLQAHHPRYPATVAYNAAKGGVVNMTRALAAEWGPLDIRVNALAPGFFPTKMTHGTIAKFGDAMIENTPLGKLGSDHDLKGAALLLASQAGSHITGQVIVVDGGTTII